MTRMRAYLLAGAVAVGAALALGPVVFTQSVNCAGSFTPNFNCIVSGLWNFTNTATTAYPAPFLVQGAEVNGLASTVTNLTNAQVLSSLNTNAGVTVVPAPGAGKFIDVIGVSMEFKYTAAYTSPQNVRLYYSSRTGGNAASPALTGSGFFDASANKIIRVAGTPDNTNAPITNVPVIVASTTGTPMGAGDAANVVRVVVNYRVVATGF